MAQLDIWSLADGGLVVDVQHHRFDDIGTRLVIPLIPADHAPPHNARLNPIVDVEGERLVLVTQFATSLRTAELKRRVGSLRARRDDIVAAIDTLIGAG